MLEVDETFIHDNMTFKVIRGQGQGQEMTSVPFRDYFLQQQQQLFYCHYTGQKVCRRILLEQSYTYGNWHFWIMEMLLFSSMTNVTYAIFVVCSTLLKYWQHLVAFSHTLDKPVSEK